MGSETSDSPSQACNACIASLEASLFEAQDCVQELEKDSAEIKGCENITSPVKNENTPPPRQETTEVQYHEAIIGDL